MHGKRLALWSSLTLALMLAGCVRAVYEETPVGEQGAGMASPTPIVSFDLSPLATPEPVAPSSLYLQPSVISLPVGETTTINVWLEAAREVNGLLLELTFDPQVVEVVDASPEASGIQIAPGAIPEAENVARNEVVVDDQGLILYQVSQGAGTGAQGSGIVASIVLRGLAEGTSTLRFDTVTALDPAGVAVDVMPLSDGLITVLADGTPEPTPEPMEGTEQPTLQPTAQPTPVATAEATLVPTVASTVPPQPATSGGIYYVVQPGENLFRIGQKFGTTAQAIAAVSGLSDPDEVSAGTMVLVPVSPPQGDFGYFVQRHDTVYSVARRFGMTVEQLVSLNGIDTGYHIEPGQTLTVTP